VTTTETNAATALEHLANAALALAGRLRAAEPPDLSGAVQVSGCLVWQAAS